MGSLPTHSDPDALFIEHDGQYYRQHPNGGGLVALTASVRESTFVGPSAVVSDYACVDGEYYLVDEARVGGHATLRGTGRIKDRSRVDGWATLDGFVIMTHSAVVTGHAFVGGRVTLEFDARVEHGSRLEGTMLVSG